MNTEPGWLIGNKLSFLKNSVLVCETMMTTFVLDAMPVNTAFHSALSNVIRGRWWGFGLQCNFVSWAISVATNLRLSEEQQIHLRSAITQSPSLSLRHPWSYLSTG
ncbi:hypothetical protein TNCV_4342901 [Trichonephila clavipes]|nr:hypothetical protein TNCV_4342901 [Trichonephila clavipes]